MVNSTEPTENSMFLRAGRGGSTTQKNSDVAEALPEVAKQISCTLNPPADQSNRSIENHSKCYKQLSELNSLNVAGVLTEEEYVTEKGAVRTVLNNVDVSYHTYTIILLKCHDHYMYCTVISNHSVC